MIKLLLSFLLLLGLAQPTLAQSRIVPAPLLPSDSLTHRIKLAGVVKVPGVSAAELQARAREWVALTFQDAHQVTQLDDAARGVLIVRGYTNMWVKTKYNGTGGTAQPLAFTLRFDFREGRYHFEVRDLGQVFSLTALGYSSTEYATSDASRQVALWQTGGAATVEASHRQALFQPSYASTAIGNDVAKRFDRDWTPIATALYQAMTQLLDSLVQHETAAPAKW